MTKRLPQVRSGLGQPTIMDPALSARHGSAYVRLVVFAIDIDRAYTQTPPELQLPFAWEVWLTELQLLSVVSGLDAEAQRALIEDVCLSILEQPPDQAALGSQLVFAAYDALSRALLPATLHSAFRSWRARPRQLLGALEELHTRGEALLPDLCAHCRMLPLEPPLAELTQQALSALERQP